MFAIVVEQTTQEKLKIQNILPDLLLMKKLNKKQAKKKFLLLMLGINQ
jgi:hypothetical protein